MLRSKISLNLVKNQPRFAVDDGRSRSPHSGGLSVRAFSEENTVATEMVMANWV